VNINKPILKDCADINASIKIQEVQAMYSLFGTVRFELFANAFLNSTCEENAEGKVTSTPTRIDNHFDELRCQVFIITLIKRINDNDQAFSRFQRNKGGVRHRQHRLDHELFELVVERFLINSRVALMDVLNQGFGSGNGLGKLISECKNQVMYGASISCSSTEEETIIASDVGAKLQENVGDAPCSEFVIGITPFSDGPCNRRFSGPSRPFEPANQRTRTRQTTPIHNLG
jgi:hypothetical protein